MMVAITLYAQPIKSEPVLDPGYLKRGLYRPLTDCINVSFNINYPYFTDIGNAVWRTAQKFDANTKIELIESGLTWKISILIPALDIRIVLNSVHYKGVFTVDNNLCVSISLEGDGDDIADFAREFVEYLGRKAWEMADWGAFYKATGIAKSTAISRWNKILAHETSFELKPDIVSGLKSRIDSLEQMQAVITKLKNDDPNIYTKDISMLIRTTVRHFNHLLDSVESAFSDRVLLVERKNVLFRELENMEKRVGAEITQHVVNVRAPESAEDYVLMRIDEIRKELETVKSQLYRAN